MTMRAWVFAASVVVLASLTSVASAREEVVFKDALPEGTIVVKQKEKRLYFVTGEGKAVRYKVAVGMPGKQWNGTAAISSKHLRPAWMPPQEVKRDKPSLPDLIAGGAPNNPMGEAALVLDRDEYAIHGTNVPTSIGRAASYGCIRMHNEDILDLYKRVRVGTQVVVMK